MNEPLGVLGTPHIGFFALIIIGGLAGWIAGSELADMANIAVRHTLGHFIAALVGSVALLYIWQLISKRSSG